MTPLMLSSSMLRHGHCWKWWTVVKAIVIPCSCSNWQVACPHVSSTYHKLQVLLSQLKQLKFLFVESRPQAQNLYASTSTCGSAFSCCVLPCMHAPSLHNQTRSAARIPTSSFAACAMASAAACLSTSPPRSDAVGRSLLPSLLGAALTRARVDRLPVGSGPAGASAAARAKRRWPRCGSLSELHSVMYAWCARKEASGELPRADAPGAAARVARWRRCSRCLRRC
eukprot:190529-Chlamydomonas_euryale.AAC.4